MLPGSHSSILVIHRRFYASLESYESLAGLLVSDSPDGVSVSQGLGLSVHRLSHLFHRVLLPVATIPIEPPSANPPPLALHA